MTRRRFIALVSLCVLVMLGLLVVVTGLVITRSGRGQEEIRRLVEQRVGASIDGRLHLGHISGSFLTGITIDSLELRDEQDSLFVATGRITLEYDPRDLVDRRLLFRRVDIEHPNIVLRQHENWEWNFKRLFRIGKKSGPKGPERGFGDFVVIDSVHIRHGGSFRLTIPWHADDSLHGARLDSAVRVNIARNDHEIRRRSEGFTQNYRWTNAYAFLPHVLIADPDSAGMHFVFDTLHVEESMPPFSWRNVRGEVRVLGDSAWVKSPHWDLPGSTGRAEGKVVWGSDKPVRYAIRITGDSVSLKDVAWVYPTLPRTGGGRMVLDIKNERNLHLLDYAITDMDVQTTKSRLRGNITFETGGPVLAVHDVKMQADPVDFDLLRVLNGKPFPADWQGKLTGHVLARGGPLTHFVVDSSNLTFADAHVPGAVSHLRGHGELDILYPAFTAFHNFSAVTDHFDLRTLVAIYPAFPRVTGVLSGRAVLDSSWLDVRVSNADLTHTDGPAEPTHATGGGRITYGDLMRYDLTLQAAPLSLTTLALSYPKLPLRGTFNGPITVRGIAPDLDVQADLTGPAGHLTYAGKADADSLGGYGAHGSGTFDALDAAMLVGRTTPPSRLTGEYDVNLTGDSLATLAGALAVRLSGSDVDGVRIARGVAYGQFDRGVMQLDTVRLEGTPGTLRASGVLGLTRSAGTDSLRVAMDVDSLGGLRRYLRRATDGAAAQSPQLPLLDSLAGALTFRGTARGWLDSLDIRGTVAGRALLLRGDRAHTVSGTVALLSRPDLLTGSLDLRADSIVASGMRVSNATLGATLFDASHARFAASANANNGSALRAAGDWRSSRDSTVVQLDSFALDVSGALWGLLRPSRVVQTATGLVLDTLVLSDGHGARIAGFIDAPLTAAARIRFVGDSIPLADLGLLAQLPNALAGRLSFDFAVAGTRALPTMTVAAAGHDIRYGALAAEALTASGSYGGERATLETNLLRNGRSVLDASVSYPVALTLWTARVTSDSLRGRVHADSVDLALVEALAPKLKNTTGRLALDLAVSGVPGHPHVGGRAVIRNGGMEIPGVGLSIAGLGGQVNVDAARDSMVIDQLRWTSPASGGTASLQGSVVFRDLANPRLDLRLDARGFRAVDKRGLARLDVSTGESGLTIAGTPEEATLSGAVIVDRGTIFIPELVRKQVVDLSADDFALLFDTTDVRNRSLMPQPPSALVEHLRLDGVSVRLGDEVWLRSREASIKLGGSLNVTRARNERATNRSTLGRAQSADSARYQLALSGALSADRGTYTLDLTAVQREFQVESGRITFFGTPDFNPEIDVSALYRVKQASRSDIGIKARIHGPFYPQPQLELSSTDAYLSPSDLVSYLVTGRPSFELTDQNTAAAQRALEFVLPTIGASVSRALREQLGGFVDLFQIQSGAVTDPLDKSLGSTGSPFRSFLSSTRLGGEKQISDRLFLSFSTGLCFTGAGSEDAAQQGLGGFVNAIEGKVEYRFPLIAPDRLSLRAGLDPAASALRCGRTVRGFAPTPQQIGFSLFRSWVF